MTVFLFVTWAYKLALVVTELLQTLQYFTRDRGCAHVILLYHTTLSYYCTLFNLRRPHVLPETCQTIGVVSNLSSLSQCQCVGENARAQDEFLL
jgi:hypothetical protein